MIISVAAAKLLVSQKMYGFYWATLYIVILVDLFEVTSVELLMIVL